MRDTNAVLRSDVQVPTGWPGPRGERPMQTQDPAAPDRSETPLTLTEHLEAWAPVLDATGTNVFVADTQFTLVFANRRAMTTLRTIEPHIISSFGLRVDEVMGGSIHRFHRSPERIERILTERGFSLPHQASFTFGGVTLSTVIDRISLTGQGTIGYLVAWEDTTALEEFRRGVRDMLESFETSAAAVEELTVSIAEIALSAGEAVNATRRGVAQSEEIAGTVSDLGDASTAIGEVVSTIANVAWQTNLLAINATIEAAREGEAGKGFAVVAKEVKQLATRTANATTSIDGRISDLQSQIVSVVSSLGGITQRLGEIDDIQASVASTVEEQQAATAQLSESIHEAATRSRTLLDTSEDG